MMPDESVACPVCRWPGQRGSGPCEHCGWLHGTARFAGTGITLEDRFGHALADCQREHDLVALARAARGREKDSALRARLAPLVRGTPPDATQIDQAIQRADQEDRHPAASSPGLGFVLTRLVAAKTDAVAFIEIGRDAISVRTLTVTEKGTLADQVSDSLPWSSLLPLLPADVGLRYLRMAGGVGVRSRESTVIHPARAERARVGPADDDTGPAGLLNAVNDAITPALTRLMAASSAAAAPGRRGRPASDSGDRDIPGHDWSTRRAVPAGRRGSPGFPGRGAHRVDTILVRRTHAWPLLEEAAARARAVLRPVAEIVALDTRTLADVVAGATARAPLRHSYDLVLARVDREGGAISPVTCRLFPAGMSVASGGPGCVRAIELAPADEHGSAEVVLPVVERRGPVPDIGDLSVVAERWPLVRMSSVAVDSGSFTLRVRLTGPGKLELVAMPGRPAADVQAPSWPQVLAEVPDRLSPSSPEVDLVVLIELGDAGDGIVADRVALARDLVTEFGHEPEARVAVLGYRDHFGKHRVDAIAGPNAVEDEALIVGCGLSSPAGALAVLSRQRLWRQVPINDRHAAPVECALGPLLAAKFGWRQGARHTLIIIGRRPPHPERASADGDVMLPCPHHHSWHRMLAKLRRRQALECLAVLDGHPDSPYAQQAWELLAERGTRRLGTAATTSEQLKQATGMPERIARRQLATLAKAGSPTERGKETGS